MDSRRETAVMLLKAALATVVAWQFTVLVLKSPQPFYGPMAALLVVDKTIVRSLGASAQRLGAVVVGMLVAWAVGTAVGVHWWSMLPVLVIALLIGRWRRFGEHGIQVPTMVLLSLLTAGGTDTHFTYLTIVETLVGGVIGVVTNALVVPPLHVREPRAQLDALTRRLGELLGQMATGLREGWDAEDAHRWYDESAEAIRWAPQVQGEIEAGRESTRFNPRETLSRLDVDWGGYADTAEAVRRTQWQVSGVARTLVDTADDEPWLPPPSQEFLDSYAAALDHIGAAVGHFGLVEDSERATVRHELVAASRILDDLGDRVREARLDDPRAWPAYGALIVHGKRLARTLDQHHDRAVVPTDSGPIRQVRRWRTHTPGST
jgi:hypothetical protein